MVETNTRSKEEQAASLQFELKNLEAERDAIPTYRASERQRVQSEIDKIQSHLDALNSGTRSEQKAEVAPKVELSVSDMVRLVVEYNNLKKAQSELNSAHSDRKRIDAELVKISEELKRNNVDTDNRLMMGLIDTIQVVTKELNDLRNKAATAEAINEPTVEMTSAPEAESDPAEAAFRKKSLETSGLLTNLDEALNLFNTDRVKGAAEINRVVALLETVSMEAELIIGEVKNEDTKQKYQERWDKKNVASRIEEAKKIVASEEPIEDGASAADETEESETGAGNESGEAESPAPVEDAEKENQPSGRMSRLFRRITGVFTGGFDWVRRNAGGRDEVVAEATEEANANNETEPTLSPTEQRAKQLYEIQDKSIGEITKKIKQLVEKKATQELNTDDINQLAFALDSLYMADAIVNDEETPLAQDQQEYLQARIAVAGDELFKDGFGVEFSELMKKMEKVIPEKEDLDETRDERLNWLVDYLKNGDDRATTEDGAGDAAPGLNSVEL
ncbi:hypothetical protein KJZ63_03850 [Patescibacteria group bacterium]|nr:hypothetical protein [Patescibacteria group bacterium]